jgi:adhesin transport system outer membrane protein
VVAFAACVHHGGATASSLDDIVRYAVSNHPQMRIATAQREGAVAGIAEARAAYLPQVTLAADGGKRRLDNDDGPGKIYTERSASLTVSQTLYDGGARRADVSRQQAREQAMAARERETRERLAISAVEAYANYLSARDMHALAQENLESHRAVASKLRDLVRIDAGRRFELSQAQARESLAQVVLTARAVRLRESAIQFERVVGKAPESLDALRMPALPGSREVALVEALRANPALAIAEAEIRTSEHNLTFVAAQDGPHVSMDFTTRRARDYGGAPGRNGDNSAMISASWKLFDGGAARARRRQATAELAATQATADDTRRTIKENLEVAWNNLQGHAESNRELDEQVRFARETLSAYHDQFRIGRRSVLDVLNAENELFTARSNLVSGQYSERVAAFQLMALEGKLFEAIAFNGRR